MVLFISDFSNKKDPDIEFVWFLNKNAMGKEMPNYIKKVPNTLISRAYWLNTFHEELDLVFTGHASEDVAKIVSSILKNRG